MLRVLFQSLQFVLCYCLLGAGTALTPVWSRGNYLRWLALGYVGMRQVEAGAVERAKRSANDLLTLADRFQDDWHFGNAIHKGNLILGRAALREGDLEAAKHYLLEAGRAPGGSPQLESIGPNMTLAKELLEAGEKDAVLEYIKLCGTFWEMGSVTLSKWLDQIQKGQVPNFGPHLHY